MTEPAEPEPDEAPPATPPLSRLRRVPLWVLVIVGVAAGAALGLGVAALVGGDDGGGGAPTLSLGPSDTRYPPEQAANAEEFLTAWERYRRATFVATYSFERLLPDGQHLDTARTVVQAPPRRLVRQGASVTATADDGSLACEPVNDQTVCTPQPGIDYEASITDELDGWRQAITGDAPQYAVDVPEAGCFDLTRVVDMVAPPYGEVTRVCFDAATGAVLRRQITRTTGTDTEIATEVSGTIADADWSVDGG